MNKLNLHPEGDHIVRALGVNSEVRMTAIRSTQTVTAASEAHGLSPIAAVALGRFMSGLQLISQDLKNPGDLLSGKIKSDGPLQGITAVANEDGTVKGYVDNPVVESIFYNDKKFNVAAAVGNGNLSITRKQAGAKPYTGSVPLISGEIAEDLTYYLYQSEQLPTILALGVLCDENGIKHAGGLMVQAFPGAKDETIDYLEQRIAGFPEISYLMEEGFDPAEILNLFIGADIEYLSVKESKFYCDCSKDRMYDALLTLGAEDLLELSEDESGIELICEFCNKVYNFAQDELKEIYSIRKDTLEGN